MALTEEFAGIGLHFAGPVSKDGGGVLDECGNFGVTGHSSPNFLAFNTGGTFADGGTPQGPETITFDFPVTHFQANVGHTSSGTIIFTAYNSEAGLVDSGSTGPSSALATIMLQGSDIRSVVITFTGSSMVLDDLAFTTGATPVPINPLALFALAGTFGLLLMLTLRSKSRVAPIG